MKQKGTTHLSSLCSSIRFFFLSSFPLVFWHLLHKDEVLLWYFLSMWTPQSLQTINKFLFDAKYPLSSSSSDFPLSFITFDARASCGSSGTASASNISMRSWMACLMSRVFGRSASSTVCGMSGRFWKSAGCRFLRFDFADLHLMHCLEISREYLVRNWVLTREGK